MINANLPFKKSDIISPTVTAKSDANNTMIKKLFGSTFPIKKSNKETNTIIPKNRIILDVSIDLNLPRLPISINLTTYTFHCKVTYTWTTHSMSKAMLNAIIVLSIVLLVIAFFINPPFSQPKTTDNASPVVSLITPFNTLSLVNEPTGTPSDPLIPCNNLYFPLHKRELQTYKATMQSKKKNNVSVSFTNYVIEASGSSVILESKIAGVNKPTKQTIICRKSGMFGFPFPTSLFLEENDKTKQLSTLGNLDSIFSILTLIPNGDILSTGKKYKLPLSLDLLENDLLKNLPITIALSGTVVKREIIPSGNFKPNEERVILSEIIKPSFDSVQIPLPNSSIQIDITLIKDVGILEYSLKTDGENSTTILISLQGRKQ